jgi:hypothetical protein
MTRSKDELAQCCRPVSKLCGDRIESRRRDIHLLVWIEDQRWRPLFRCHLVTGGTGVYCKLPCYRNTRGPLRTGGGRTDPNGSIEQDSHRNIPKLNDKIVNPWPSALMLINRP